MSTEAIFTELDRLNLRHAPISELHDHVSGMLAQGTDGHFDDEQLWEDAHELACLFHFSAPETPTTLPTTIELN